MGTGPGCCPPRPPGGASRGGALPGRPGRRLRDVPESLGRAPPPRAVPAACCRRLPARALRPRHRSAPQVPPPPATQNRPQRAAAPQGAPQPGPALTCGPPPLLQLPARLPPISEALRRPSPASLSQQPIRLQGGLPSPRAHWC